MMNSDAQVIVMINNKNRTFQKRCFSSLNFFTSWLESFLDKINNKIPDANKEMISIKMIAIMMVVKKISFKLLTKLPRNSRLCTKIKITVNT